MAAVTKLSWKGNSGIPLLVEEELDVLEDWLLIELDADDVVVDGPADMLKPVNWYQERTKPRNEKFAWKTTS